MTLPPFPGHLIPLVVLTVAAAVASMFVLDHLADTWAHGEPPWFRALFERITRFGLSGWFLYPFGCIVLALAALSAPSLPRLTRGVLALLAVRFGFLFLAIGVPGLFVTITKGMIGRARPFVGPYDNPFSYKPFIWHPAYASMPSGHSATVVSAAIAIGAIWPRSRPVMWLYALVIMFSRVAVLAHHPSDVIAGAFVGAAGAVLVRRWFAARRLGFRAADLAPFPGPSLRRAAAALRLAVLGSPRRP